MPPAEDTAPAPLRPVALVDRLPPGARRWATTFGPAVGLVLVQLVLFPAPAGVELRGLIIGLLGALVAVGMALVYRANRILNFAQADLGSVPTVLVVLLITFSGLPYLLAFGVGLAAAVVLGAVVELAIIRRFTEAPRLILTVATIGLTQLLVVGGLLLPYWWGVRPSTYRVEAPFTFRFTVEPVIFNANDLLALVVAPLAMVAIAVFLRRTAVGIGVRAAAERRDRAALLGVPVRGLQTLVWVIAAVLAFLALFLRAGVLGLPFGFAGSFLVLLSAFAALMMGRLTDLPAVATSAVALGMLEVAVDWNTDQPLLIQPILALVIISFLLLRRRGVSRAAADETSSWQAAADLRAVPPELAHLPEVRWVRTGLIALGAVVLLVLPHLLGAEDSLKVSAIIIFAVIGVSVVVLTGWAGQVSLGQMAFAAVGAVAGAKLTAEWGWDLTLALLAAGLCGALAAMVVGVPALRLRGLYLAVTTLGFSLATSAWLLNPSTFDWIPDGRIERAPIFGRISYESPTGIYYVALATFLVVVWMVVGLRRSRTGRVLVAVRENEPAAQSFGISVTRAKLTAFAVSGFVAAVGGALLVHHQQSYRTPLFGPAESFNVFTTTVVGGVGSVFGSVLGAIYLRGSQWLLPAERWQTLATAAGVLLVLMILPGGLTSLVDRVRTLYLRRVADRRGIVVPSLVADVAEAAPPELDEGAASAGGPSSDQADDPEGRLARAAAAAEAAAEAADADHQPDGEDDAVARAEVHAALAGSGDGSSRADGGPDGGALGSPSGSRSDP